MKILYLGPHKDKMITYLKQANIDILQSEDPITDSISKLEFDYVISYGYRYIMGQDFVERNRNRIINLHISLLPWNRGADPNLWSFLENTPKGVSIHYIDRGIDTGDIIAQKTVAYDHSDTMRTSYERLSKHIEDLFMEVWPAICQGTINSYPQVSGGSYHSIKDKEKFKYLLTHGWDTPVIKLISKALP